MPRRVFFSFDYSDVNRALVVRNGEFTAGEVIAGLVERAEFEAVERQGDTAVKAWIDGQMGGTSVTVVLVGADTCKSQWVCYAIMESIKRGNGLLGLDVSGIKGFDGNGTYRSGRIPHGYPYYNWIEDGGYRNLGGWIAAAARVASRNCTSDVLV